VRGNPSCSDDRSRERLANTVAALDSDLLMHVKSVDDFLLLRPQVNIECLLDPSWTIKWIDLV
jgi:hypothetical protein